MLPENPFQPNTGHPLGDRRHEWATEVAAMQSHDGVFIPSPLAALRWRQTRTRVAAGDKQAHIMVAGDSIPFGAAATGASNPKPKNSWPGRLRSMLDRRFGYAGGGLTLANPSVLTNIPWDPRWKFVGDVTNHTFGPFSNSTYRVNGTGDATSGDAYFEFTDDCSEFWVYTLSAGHFIRYSIDGAPSVRIGNSNLSANREPGYFVGTGTVAHNVFKIPAGARGVHTIRMWPEATSTDIFLTMIEGRVPTAGTFRVGSMSISSKSLSTFVPTDEVNGTVGLVFLDTAKADLLVLALGINDWQGKRDVETVKGYLRTVIDRQRSTAPTLGGGTHAGGDVVLLWNPRPDIDGLGTPVGSIPPESWDQYRQAYREIAIEKDVCLIDMSERWGGYDVAVTLGLYADLIHPNDNGADDIAAGVLHALFDVI